MRWRVLGPLLLLLLVGALAFSRWAVSTPEVELAAAAVVAPPIAPGAPPVGPPAPPRPPSPAPPAPPSPPPSAAPAPAPASPTATPAAEDDRFGEPEEPADDPEPEDGGVLHPLTRDGIREAVRQAQPELKECYEAWLQQSPDLGGRVKVVFTIAGVPGRERGRVMDVDTPPDAGLGHLAFEGCVRNVFRGLRFEKPERGELHVTYPLTFSNEPKARPQ